MLKLSSRRRRVVYAAVTALLAMLLSIALVAAATISVDTNDGAITGWQGSPSITDPQLDADGPLDITQAWIGDDGAFFYFRIDTRETAFHLDHALKVELDCDGDGAFGGDGDRRLDYWFTYDMSPTAVGAIFVLDGNRGFVAQYSEFYGEAYGTSGEWKAPVADLGACGAGGAFNVRFVVGPNGEDVTAWFPYESTTSVTVTRVKPHGNVVPFVVAGVAGMGLCTVIRRPRED